MHGNLDSSSAFLTPAELAARWKVSDQTILNECRAGKIPHFKVGRQIRMKAQAILAIESAADVPSGKPTKKSDLMDNIPDEIGD